VNSKSSRLSLMIARFNIGQIASADLTAGVRCLPPRSPSTSPELSMTDKGQHSRPQMGFLTLPAGATAARWNHSTAKQFPPVCYRIGEV